MLLAHTAYGALEYKGADWSSVAVLERDGVEYKNLKGTVAPLEDILAENGINVVRQRVVSTSPHFYWPFMCGGSVSLAFHPRSSI